MLGLFVPLCISTGGNSGSQAATLITRALALGQLTGRDWLRVSRGADPRAGVLGREHRLKALRTAAAAADERLEQAERELSAARERLAQAEERREQAQTAIQGAHQKHAGLLGLLEAHDEPGARILTDLGISKAAVEASTLQAIEELRRARAARSTE